MEEMYSINASMFMGKSEVALEKEEQDANFKFEELLKLEGIWSEEDDDK